MGRETSRKRDSRSARIPASPINRDRSPREGGAGGAEGSPQGPRPRLITISLADVVRRVLEGTVVGSVVNFAYKGETIRVLFKHAILGAVPAESKAVVLKHRPATGSLVRKNGGRATAAVGFLPNQ
jgi:hypothetical protein